MRLSNSNEINRVKIGKEFESKAKDIFKEEGYNILEHSSEKKWNNLYDFKISKNNRIYFIEVKGISYDRTFTISKSKIDNLKKLNNVLLLLIKKDNYIFINIEQINQNKKQNNFKDFKIYIPNELNKNKHKQILTKLIRNDDESIQEIIIKGNVKKLGDSGYIAIPRELIGKFVELKLRILK